METIGKPGPDDKAPAFKAERDGAETISLKDFRGKTVVLYFYPKDDTPGCTKEAIAFTDHLPEFEDANAVVIGVSRDAVKKHEKFRDKHNLKVILVADEAGTITEGYGVWVEKSMYGKTYMGIERSTFLIDSKGKIVRVWRKVKLPEHVAEVLEAVKSL